jgi:hypothetical protein
MGCVAAAAGAVGGVVLSNEFADNATYVTHLNTDVKKVWPLAKTVLSDSTLEVIEVDEQVRLAKAKIDNSTVTVQVDAYDVDKSILQVKARKFGTFPDGETARLISEKITRRLQN